MTVDLWQSRRRLYDEGQDELIRLVNAVRKCRPRETRGGAARLLGWLFAIQSPPARKRGISR